MAFLRLDDVATRVSQKNEPFDGFDLIMTLIFESKCPQSLNNLLVG